MTFFPPHSPRSATDLHTSSVSGRVPLTPELRQALCQKRVDLQASLQDVSQVLGVHWTTYRKWEEGRTRLLSSTGQQAIRDFLSGKFDYYLRGRHSRGRVAFPGLGTLGRILASDTEVGLLVRMLCDTYALLGDDRRERKLLRQSVEEVLRRSLLRLEQRASSVPECEEVSVRRHPSASTGVNQA